MNKLLLLIVASLLIKNNVMAQETIITGELTTGFEKQLSDAAEWKNNKDIYIPDAEAAQHIATYAHEFDLIVVIGTWCEDSRTHYPALIKTLETAEAQFKSFKIIGVDRDKKSDLQGFEQLNISYVPTLILLKDGKEINRIVETPRKSIEKDLAELIHTR
jgi:thiol-disulfide isomerase/thioredoxin